MQSLYCSTLGFLVFCFVLFLKKCSGESAFHTEGALSPVKWREGMWMGLFRKLPDRSNTDSSLMMQLWGRLHTHSAPTPLSVNLFFHSYHVWEACCFLRLSWNWGKETGSRVSESATELTTVLTKIQLFFLINALCIIVSIWWISRFLKKLILTIHPVFLLLI